MGDAPDAGPAWRVLVVDDESLARQKLRRYLAETGDELIVEEAVNGLEAVGRIASFRPDVVLLDVEMPGLGGLEVLDQFPEAARPFTVIFQTAYDDFAVKAFEQAACDYLLKPFTRERFHKAWAKARLERGRAVPFTAVQARMTEEKRYLERLCVDERGLRIVVELSEAEALVTRDDYTCVHAGDREYLTDLSLASLEARLDPEVWIRIHRTTLVRVAAVRSLSKGAEAEVTLASGRVLAVSRRCRGALVDRLKSG
jgi:two-component system LytT family response regulator